MFYFVVRHLRWAARVPGFPHLFDGLLLARTWLFQHARIGAMELLEAEALRLPGVRLKVHRFGGIEFVEKAGHELGHLHDTAYWMFALAANPRLCSSAVDGCFTTMYSHAPNG